MREFPRLLFITGSAFNNITGTGITFSNLFRGWPQDRLFTAHNDLVPVSVDVCAHYYGLGLGEISRWPCLGTRSPGGPQQKVTPFATAAPTRSTLFRIARDTLVGRPWPDCARLTPELEAWIATAQPDLIYTILGNNGMAELVRLVRDRFRLPVAVHFMDDYPSNLYRGGLFSPLIRRRMFRLLDDIVGKASARLAIGDKMAAAYQARWHVPFASVQNAVDVGRVPTADPIRDIQAPMRLAYIGSIFSYAQSDSLADIAAAVARLADAGRPITLDIYSPAHLLGPFRAQLEIHPAIRTHDTIRDDPTFFRTLAEMDVLVLPVNFDRATVDYIRYSMPTKVPAYLASGTPILAYGPSEVAQIAYAQREGWALTVTQREPAMLEAAIRQLGGDNDLRQRISARARSVACRHDIHHVQQEFQSVLVAAASF